ncbi:barstar family protein [Streptomyces sp. RLB1-33]|uniref:barstar family protein n=1 Tax=Streptomyces mirabilis TaxID=68239 RepID=UPI00143E6616|nr:MULTISPECIES: barstar family protein [Streptomyces]QIY69815.1 barstar family protein [Streptomyces sp. RLB1-33]QUW83315.1 barstar family protein [Streptomyces mirabilis]
MTDGPLAEVFRAARAVGWQVSVLDLTGVSDKAAFMERCVRALDLPEWFGRNWDALVDCLGDPDWGPASPGRVILVNGWRHYAKARPDEWETAQEVLESAAGHYEEHDATLSVVLSLGGSDQLPPDQPG